MKDILLTDNNVQVNLKMYRIFFQNKKEKKKNPFINLNSLFTTLDSFWESWETQL